MVNESVPQIHAGRRPRLLFLNRSYWPDAEATGQLLTELCEDLAERFDVSVIAGAANSNPTNAGYRRWGTDQRNGVTIHRVLHTRFSKRRLLGRTINLKSFLAASTIRAMRLPRPDVIITETDPFLLASIGRRLKNWFGCRFIAYLQDIYPDVAVSLRKIQEGRLTARIRRSLAKSYQAADRVIVLSEDMRQRISQWGIDRSRIESIPNWVDTNEILPIKGPENEFMIRQQLAGRFIVMHSGNMGLSQQLDTLLDAANRLRSYSQIQFLLVGDGANRAALENRASSLELTNLEFHGYQPKSALAHSLSAADVHIISTHPDAIACLMPSKLYGILASGTPVIAVVPEDSELARIVEGHAVGFAVEPYDVDQLVDRVRYLAEHPEVAAEMGVRARKLAESQYDRRVITARFAGMIDDVLGSLSAKDSSSTNAPHPESLVT